VYSEHEHGSRFMNFILVPRIFCLWYVIKHGKYFIQFRLDVNPEYFWVGMLAHSRCMYESAHTNWVETTSTVGVKVSKRWKDADVFLKLSINSTCDYDWLFSFMPLKVTFSKLPILPSWLIRILMKSSHQGLSLK